MRDNRLSIITGRIPGGMDGIDKNYLYTLSHQQGFLNDLYKRGITGDNCEIIITDGR
ncbi:MAG: hypothetical protein HZB79_02490 [Deltaproteobacteria bacterium]|nr:hypothetical protein [Deltaproteobacteria bacterium]